VKRLLVATRSPGKQREFRVLLRHAPFELVFPDDAGMSPDPAEASIECHDTFEGNARAKARWFASRSGVPTLADDSGLEVGALGGAPGVHSRRWGGAEGSEAIVTAANNALLLSHLADTPDDRRIARYRCVLVLTRVERDDDMVAFGDCTGRILRAPRGNGGFGYDPLFLSDDLGASFAEVDDTVKHQVSHRARAVADLLRQVGRSAAVS
jgi:XTP/dITP diphosphohydrolase